MKGSENMSVRPVDMQIIIPKASEVQKAKMMELLVPVNNELVDMNKDKKELERKVNQVNRKEKPEEIRINEERERERKREEAQKERESRREKLLEERKKESDENQKSKKSFDSKKQPNKIDIRV